MARAPKNVWNIAVMQGSASDPIRTLFKWGRMWDRAPKDRGPDLWSVIYPLVLTTDDFPAPSCQALLYMSPSIYKIYTYQYSNGRTILILAW